MTTDESSVGAMGSGSRLPMPAERLIPHRGPMRFVDTLLSRNALSGVTESRIPSDAVVAGEGGRLDETAFVELIAQSYATIKGHLDLSTGAPPATGFLVGIRDFTVVGPAHADEPLQTSVRCVGSHGGYAVVDGIVTRGGETLAVGTVTLWIPAPDVRPVP